MQIDDPIYLNYISQIDDQSADTGSDSGFSIGSTPSNITTPQQNEQVNEIIANRGRIGGWIIESYILTAANININSAVPSISMGGATDYFTGTGIWMGLNEAYYRLHIGNPSADYLKWDGTNLTVTGTIIATTATIASTLSDSFTINADATDANVDLVFSRTTGGDATLRWNGTTLNFDKTVTIGGVGIALSTVTLTAGAGLTGGGDLSANRTFAVGAGLGLTVNADDVALTTPGTLTVATTNSSTGSHTHAITTSSNPGATASILASTAAGALTLVTYTGNGYFDLTAPSMGQVRFTNKGAGAGLDNYLNIDLGEAWTSGITLSAGGSGGSLIRFGSTPVVNDNVYLLFGGQSSTGMGFINGASTDDGVLTIKTCVAGVAEATGIVRIVNSQAIPAQGTDASLNDPHFRIYGGTTSITDYVELYHDQTNANLTTGEGSLIIAPAGDIIFNPTGNDILPTTGYDLNLGSLGYKYLTLHAAELWVETLVAQNTIATIGGRILVGPTTSLVRDLAAAGTTIYVKHNEMASGDRVYMEANSKVEFMAITSAPTTETDGYSYTVTRNLDGTGANDWFAGDAMFNTGTTGDGFIDIYSVAGVKAGTEYGPAIAGNVRNSATYNDWTSHWAIGQLNGLYGYSGTTYGVAFGEYAASKAHLTIDTTNGIRFFTGTATVIGQWSPTGGITLGSTSTEHVAISSTAVQIKDGATVYTDLTGGVLSLGLTSAEHVLINTSGVALKDNTSTYALFAATTTIGITSSEHVSISSTSVQIKDNTSVYTDLTAGVLTLGLSSGGEYITVDGTNGIKLYGNAVESISITNAGLITVGEVGASKSNIQISSNAIKLRTNTTDKIVLGTNGNITLTGNLAVGTAGAIYSGQTAYDTGTGFWLEANGGTPRFSIGVGGSAANNMTWDGTSLTINGYAQTNIGNFGGNGADGAKTVSADENLDLGSAVRVVKNYTTLTIDATKTLTGINPHANGTITILKVKGNCVINGTIDMGGCGGAGGTGGTGNVNGGVGTAGYKVLLFDSLIHGGGGGDGGTLASGSGGGGGGHQSAGTAGTMGEAPGPAGIAGVALTRYDAFIDQNLKARFFAAGSGGGGGGGSDDDANPDKKGGDGGNGGGVLVLEVGGNLTFGASSNLKADGNDGAAGANGTSRAAGGGGGGSGGQIYILYNGTLTDGGVTTDITGGTGGAAGTATNDDGGAGGNGGDGDYYIDKNYTFA